MKNLVYIIDEIGLGATDVTKMCISARASIVSGQAALAKKEIAEAMRVVRQITVMANTVRDVIDAMDAGQIAQGDLDAANTVYQEA